MDKDEQSRDQVVQEQMNAQNGLEDLLEGWDLELDEPEIWEDGDENKSLDRVVEMEFTISDDDSEEAQVKAMGKMEMK